MHSTLYPNRFDTIVVGVGGMGSAAVYHLAKRGQRVLGLEQFDIPHDQGSSHGHTRIIRLPYYEDSSYVMLLVRAYELWRDLERVSGENVVAHHRLHRCRPAESVFKGALQSAVEYDQPHEFSPARVRRSASGHNLPQDHLALFSSPRAASSALNSASQPTSSRRWPWERRSTAARLDEVGAAATATACAAHTTRIYEADSLVITAGRERRHAPVPQPAGHPGAPGVGLVSAGKPGTVPPDNFPVFNLLVDEGRFYGFPVFGIPGFKIGLYHHFNETGRPEQLDHDVYWEDEEVLRECTSKYFQRLRPDHDHGQLHVHQRRTATSSSTCTRNTLRSPYVPACTGHGYKFASVIGEIMADLAQYQRTPQHRTLHRQSLRQPL
ncbi:MAG: FAD-dependent oxidoreductase [Caldilineaceae bacterium]